MYRNFIFSRRERGSLTREIVINGSITLSTSSLFLYLDDKLFSHKYDRYIRVFVARLVANEHT